MVVVDADWWSMQSIPDHELHASGTPALNGTDTH